MQILIELDWGGAWDPAFLTSSQVMPKLLVHKVTVSELSQVEFTVLSCKLSPEMSSLRCFGGSAMLPGTQVPSISFTTPGVLYNPKVSSCPKMAAATLAITLIL